MKFLVVTFALVAVAAAQQYGQQQQQQQQQQPPIAILRQVQDISPEGSYQWAYETENRISASEDGTPKQIDPKDDGPAVVVKGEYSYVGDDGVTYTVQYIADENGFQPVGAHIPTTGRR